MASLTDVAKAAGVSLTAASMVLNNGKQANRVSVGVAQRIRDAAKELGYVPNYHARSMKLGKAEAIAVALDVGFLGPEKPTTNQLGGGYFGTLVGQIELECRLAGYQMVMIGPDEHLRAPDRGVLGLRQRRFDGLIVFGSVTRTELTSVLRDSPDGPIVIVEFNGETKLPVVDFDEKSAVKLALEHLTQLGHKRVLWCGPRPHLGDQVINRREQLFIEAIWGLGLKGSSCVFTARESDLQRPDQGQVQPETEAADHRLSEYMKEQPLDSTAILCHNDRTAAGVLRALYRAKIRVPDEVSVMGFDDVEAALTVPRLTSVSHELRLMGSRSVALLLEMMRDPEAIKRLRGTRELTQPRLIVGETTAAPKK